MTASTTSLVHCDQELAASRQLLIMGWPAHMTEKDPDHEIKSMARYYAVKLQPSTTLKTKQGISHFTIAESRCSCLRFYFLNECHSHLQYCSSLERLILSLCQTLTGNNALVLPFCPFLSSTFPDVHSLGSLCGTVLGSTLCLFTSARQ